MRPTLYAQACVGRSAARGAGYRVRKRNTRTRPPNEASAKVAIEASAKVAIDASTLLATAFKNLKGFVETSLASHAFEKERLRSLQQLLEKHEWLPACDAARALEQNAARGYLDNSNSSETKQHAAILYRAVILLSACAFAFAGRPRRGLQLCDFLSLEAAPPPPPPVAPTLKALSAAISAAIVSTCSARLPARGSRAPSPPPRDDDLYRVPSRLPPDAAATLASRTDDSGRHDALGRPALRHPIRRLSTAPALDDFKRDHVLTHTPCVLTSAMDDWPCVRPGPHSWADLRRGLLREEEGGSMRGGRVVRIEMSDSPGAPIEEPVHVRFVSLAAFVDGCLLPMAHRRHHTERADDPGVDAADATAWPPWPFTFGKRDFWGLQWPRDRRRIGFLAQYQLLEQLGPELEAEIGAVPYAAALGAGFRIRRNVWIGAAGASTALHFDPKDNLLCQIAGFKYVRLYEPALTPSIPVETTDRPRMQSDMLKSSGNFALCDVESPSFATDYPKLASAPFTETILGPGDMLYIPWGCWHYCRSLTTSISLNVWWCRGKADLLKVPCFGPSLAASGSLEGFLKGQREVG